MITYDCIFSIKLIFYESYSLAATHEDVDTRRRDSPGGALGTASAGGHETTGCATWSLAFGGDMECGSERWKLNKREIKS